jgi:hypothetical protein
LKRLVPICALAIAILAALLAGISTTPAGYELVLADDRVLEGFDLRLRDGVYHLTLESGEVVTFPAELVTEVRLNDKKALKEEWEDHPDVKMDEPETLAGEKGDEVHPHVIASEPQTIAGQEGVPTKPPTTSDQLDAFGRPGNQFQKSPMDPNWTPKSAYDRDVDVLASGRSKWAESPMSNEWVPESGFRHSDPTNNFNQSKWAQSPMDNEWVPQDGFRKNKS